MKSYNKSMNKLLDLLFLLEVTEFRKNIKINYNLENFFVIKDQIFMKVYLKIFNKYIFQNKTLFLKYINHLKTLNQV